MALEWLLKQSRAAPLTLQTTLLWIPGYQWNASNEEAVACAKQAAITGRTPRVLIHRTPAQRLCNPTHRSRFLPTRTAC